MRIVNHWTLGVALVVVLAVSASADNQRRFAVTDDCDANDPAWTAIGGCKIEGGQVSRAEFAAANPGGHPAWRIVPPYVPNGSEQEIRVTNTGGRDHTFTEVARFGGGFVAGINPQGAFVAPECATRNPDGTLSPAAPATATTLVPGQSLRTNELTPGTHNFQCCIHSWMRTVVKVKADDDDE
jgi:hypothetical protein